ncbi:hypothetical protein EBU24_05060 [bacterium]|nr:hypothetical protein [bacterium]
MSKVKMMLELDFVELQKLKTDVLFISSSLTNTQKEILSSVVSLIEKVQDQAIDNPQNNFTSKQVLGV